MSVGLGYLIGGSFWPFMSIAVGVMLVLRGHFPNCFARHIEEQLIARIPYRRRESYWRWAIACVIALIFASVASSLYSRIVPKKPDLAVVIKDAIRDALKTTSEAGATHKVTGVTVVFSDSPSLTSDRKARVHGQIEAFYTYLNSLGFNTPSHTGSLTIDNRVAGCMIQSIPGKPVLYDHFVCAESSLDKSDELISAYSSYAFSKLLLDDPACYRGDAGEFRQKASSTIATYFASDYLNTELSGQDGRWSAALWEIRKQFGQEMVSRSLSFQIAAMNDKSTQTTHLASFDDYMSWMFDIGETALSSSGDRFQDVDAILHKHDIITVH